MNQAWWDKFVELTEDLEESDFLEIVEELIQGTDSLQFTKNVLELAQDHLRYDPESFKK